MILVPAAARVAIVPAAAAPRRDRRGPRPRAGPSTYSRLRPRGTACPAERAIFATSTRAGWISMAAAAAGQRHIKAVATPALLIAARPLERNVDALAKIMVRTGGLAEGAAAPARVLLRPHGKAFKSAGLARWLTGRLEPTGLLAGFCAQTVREAEMLVGPLFWPLNAPGTAADMLRLLPRRAALQCRGGRRRLHSAAAAAAALWTLLRFTAWVRALCPAVVS